MAPLGIDEALSMKGALESERHTVDSHRQAVADITYPEAALFTRREPVEGQRRHSDVYDSTAARALDKGTALVESWITPRGKLFHGLRPNVKELQDHGPTKAWFDALNLELFRMRNRATSTWQQQNHMSIKSLLGFGDQCMRVKETSDGARYQSRHIGECYIATNEDGSVDTMFRVYQMTAKAIAQEMERNPEQFQITIGDMPRIAKALETPNARPFTKFELLHVVMPRIDDFDPLRIDARGMRWQSMLIAIEDKVVMSQGGAEEFEYMYSRYDVGAGEKYGRSPAMAILPTNQLLQAMKKTVISAAQQVAEPALLAAKRDALGTKNQRISLKNRFINYGGMSPTGVPMIQPLISGADPKITLEMMLEEKEAINDSFFVLLLQIVLNDAKGTKTATQVLAEAQEQSHLLGPTVGRQEAEYLGMMIRREISIVLRQEQARAFGGERLKLPPVPGLLAEAFDDIDILYINQATRAQEAEVGLGMVRLSEQAALLQPSEPRIYLKFKAPEWIDKGAEIHGVPSDLIHSNEEFEERVAEAVESERAAQESALAAEQASALADAATGAEKLSRIPQQPSRARLAA